MATVVVMSMEAYLDMLLEQVDKNRCINDLARKTREAIAAGDMGMVVESSALRGELFSQLESLGKKMEPYLVELSSRFESLLPQMRDQILTVSKQLHDIIEETIAIDRENEGKMRELKEALGERLKDIREGKKALKGYKSPSLKNPRLFDGQV